MYPHELRYSAEHAWVRRESPTVVRFGVSAWAKEVLGDVEEVSLPEPGDRVSAGEACGELAAENSTYEIVSPVDGVVLLVNDELGDSPELVSGSPYGEGWLVEVECASPAAVDDAWEGLMESDDYEGGLSG